MIKILYVSDTLKRRFGVTSVITNYIEHFPKGKVQVDLLVYDDSEKEVIEKLKKCGSNIYFMPKLSIKKFSNFKNFIRNFFENNHYDIVHSHFYQIDRIIFPIAKKYGVKKCISHSHSTKFSDYFLKSCRNKLMAYNIEKYADVLASCSEVAGVALFGKKFKNSPKKLIIHNGIDCKKFEFNELARKKIRNDLDIDNNTIVIGHVGSFKPVKNQIFLIELLQDLLNKNKNFKLLLVGDGETKSKVVEKSKELKVEENVIFTGLRTDISDLLSAMDIFVLPSLYEGFPVVGVEAQASGLECIFSDCITNEANLTDVHFLKLSDEVSKWTDKILELSKIKRKDKNKVVIEKGYDINIESRKLVDKYINLIK